MEPAKPGREGVNHDHLDLRSAVPLSYSPPKASSPRCSPRSESSGDARPSPYKSSSPSPRTRDRHKPSHVAKGTASSLVEDSDHTDLNDKFVALRKCLPPLPFKSHQQKMEETDGDDEQDRAFPEKALLRSTPQRNPSKMMILKSATDYITELEQRKESLLEEQKELQRRLSPLIMAPDTRSQPQHLQPRLYEESEGEKKRKEGEVLGLSHTKFDMKDS